MQDMEVKSIDERVSVECPGCGIISFNPKFLSPHKAKKNLGMDAPFWSKPASKIQNALWTEITLFNLVCKKCGCNFSLPVSEKPRDSEEPAEESNENEKSDKEEKEPEEPDSESKGN